jgi:hypothetical protein
MMFNVFFRRLAVHGFPARDGQVFDPILLMAPSVESRSGD